MLFLVSKKDNAVRNKNSHHFQLTLAFTAENFLYLRHQPSQQQFIIQSLLLATGDIHVCNRMTVAVSNRIQPVKLSNKGLSPVNCSWHFLPSPKFIAEHSWEYMFWMFYRSLAEIDWFIGNKVQQKHPALILLWATVFASLSIQTGTIMFAIKIKW